MLILLVMNLVTRWLVFISYLIPNAEVSVSIIKTIYPSYWYSTLLILEVKINGKVFNFIVLNRSLSQSNDKSETFSGNFEMNLEILVEKNPFLMTKIADFHGNSKS